MRDSRADAAPPERFSDHLSKASQNNQDEPPVTKDEKLATRDDGVAVHNAATQPAADDAKPAGESDQGEVKAGDDSSSTQQSTPEQTSLAPADHTVTSSASTAQRNAVHRTDPSASTNDTQSESQADSSSAAPTQPSASTATTTGVEQPIAVNADQSQVQRGQQETAQPATTPASSTNEAARTATAVTTNADATTSQARFTTSADRAPTSADTTSSVAAPSQQTGRASVQSETDQDPQQQQQPTTRQSQELQQRLRQAINNPLSGETESGTAAQRRAGQVNAAVQFEQTTGDKPVTIDSAAPTITTSAPTLDLTIESRAGQSPVVLPTGQPVDDGAVTNNVARGLSALVNQRGGVMHMRLDPPELGQLRVQMSMNQGTVNAQFQVATAQAQTVLERNIATLRTALERHGLTVERISVNVHQPAQGQQTTGQHLGDQSADQSSQEQQHNAGGGQSRGRGEQSADDRRQQSFAQFAQDELAGQPESSATLVETGAA